VLSLLCAATSTSKSSWQPATAGVSWAITTCALGVKITSLGVKLPTDVFTEKATGLPTESLH
jgi:hypothetical protein